MRHSLAQASPTLKLSPDSAADPLPRRLLTAFVALFLWTAASAAQTHGADGQHSAAPAPAETVAADVWQGGPSTTTQGSGSEEELDPLFRTPVTARRSAPTHDSGSYQLAFENPDNAQLARQLQLREYGPVLRAVERQIEDIEQDEQRYAESLVEPLLLQGDALTGLGRHEAALESYRRAVHVKRVNSGLNAPEQVTAVYREADALKRLGQLEDANDREEYAFRILLRSYGPLSPELLPGLYQLADWYNQNHNIYQSRRLYDQAVSIVEASDGPHSPRLITGLEGIAQTYFLERFPPFFVNDGREESPVGATGNAGSHHYNGARPLTISNYADGERALERIVMIHAGAESTPPQVLADAYLKLADWHLLFQKYRHAHRLYLEAQAVLATVEPDAAAALLRTPTQLHYPRPGNPRPPPPQLRGEANTGYVELEFEVSPRGTISKIRSVGSEPAGLMDFRARKSMRAARYRPALIDGELVSSSTQRYRYEFPFFETLNNETPEPTPTDPVSGDVLTTPAEVNGR